MVELPVVIVTLAIMAAFAIPTFAVWLPNYKLKSAVKGPLLKPSVDKARRRQAE